jgi:hypothetical protein
MAPDMVLALVLLLVATDDVLSDSSRSQKSSGVDVDQRFRELETKFDTAYGAIKTELTRHNVELQQQRQVNRELYSELSRQRSAYRQLQEGYGQLRYTVWKQAGDLQNQSVYC